MFAEALEITIFGMAIVFVMLILVIVSVKLIQPVRRFFPLSLSGRKRRRLYQTKSARAGPVRAEELAQAENQGAAAAAENEAVRAHACAEGGKLLPGHFGSCPDKSSGGFPGARRRGGSRCYSCCSGLLGAGQPAVCASQYTLKARAAEQ